MEAQKSQGVRVYNFANWLANEQKKNPGIAPG